MIRASVIIPSYNRSDTLRLTLAALAEQTLSSEAFEVIVVDDGSTDNSVDVVQQATDLLSLRLVRQENRGPGAARNQGANRACAPLLVFLDADMIPAPDLVVNYLRSHETDNHAVLIGRLLAWPEVFAYSPNRVFNYMLNRDPGPNPSVVPFYYIASGNFAISACLFRELEGFDEQLRMTEDTDLAYRAHIAGARCVYVPEAVGYHNHPKTFEQRCAQLRASAWWTACLMAKHPELRGQLPVYREVEPISLWMDRPSLVVRKIFRRLLVLSPSLVALKIGACVLERLAPHSRLLSFLYNTIQYSYRLIGFHIGLKSTCGNDTAAQGCAG